MTLQELSQLYHLKKEIKKDQERLDGLRNKSYSAPYTYTSLNQSKKHINGSIIDRYAAEKIDLEAIIAAKITQCIHERNRLERFITDIPDSLTRQIFTCRFVNGQSWIQVAHSIGGNNTEDAVKKICYRYIAKINEKRKKESCPACPEAK